MMRLWLLSAIAFVLNACSSRPPQIVHDKPIANTPVTQLRPTPPQNVYKPATVSYKPTISSYRPATVTDAFPIPGELEAAVEFWRKTYVVWHRSEVVFHDDRNLDVIYEVMILPGYVDDSLTSLQKELVNQRREYWKSQLAILESKWRYKAPLNANEQHIIAKLENIGRPPDRFLNGASERVHAQRGIRERFKRGLEISERYDRHFRKVFRDAGLPEDLACLPHVESSFQPSARSSAGAVGMWQFTKAAAKRFMPDGNRIDRRLNPFASAIGAARYLSYAYGILGDWPTAITSYNHGISGMKRAKDQAGPDFARIVQSYDSPSFGFASRNFYAQFLAAREIARNQKQYLPDKMQYETSLESDEYLAGE